MSLEIQDLEDLLRTLILVESGRRAVSKSRLEHRIESICDGNFCVDRTDFSETLRSMIEEGLIIDYGDSIRLTRKGAKISSEWKNFLYRDEPILEIVVGIADGSITSLVVIISSLIAGLASKVAFIASILSLAVVALTNFSSFLLGGITEDLADLETLQNLITYSLSDVSDVNERERALLLTRGIFNLLRVKRSRSSIIASLICGVTTFISGMVPLAIFLLLPHPIDMLLSLPIIGATIGFFLVYYRSRKTRMPWKIILLQTIIVIVVAVAVSLLLGTQI
ncbi:MAG: hypothetical protein QXX56_02650 [Candidatus Bathyarchaeia archaeon]